MNEVKGDIPVEELDRILKIDNVCQKQLTVAVNKEITISLTYV
jgi:hypothetical protein